MRKIFTLLALMTMFATGTRVYGQDTKARIVEDPGNRTHIADPANLADGDVVMLQTADNTSKFFAGTTKVAAGEENSYWQLIAGNDGKYKLASFISVANGAPVYVKAPTATGVDPIVTTSTESEAAQFTLATSGTGLDAGSGYVRFIAKVNNTGADTYLNCNTSANSVKFATGTGGWSYWKIFKTDATAETLYKVTFNCYNGTTLLETQEDYYSDGSTINVPTINGYALADGEPTSVTVNGASAEYDIQYNTSTYDYTLVVNGAVSGMTMTIKGEDIAYGATSYSNASEVVASDVVVSFPTEFSYLQANVTVSGTTITVNCEDTRWPVNFPKTQTFTRGDRHINSASFNDQTVDGLYVNQSTLCYQDLTATKTVTLAPNVSVKPRFNVTGAWQHGFVYIDLNNDGDFTDDGELVAKVNVNNPNLYNDIPAFTSPGAGTYRMRIKTDWASEDPGGNTAQGNYIIDNGGMIVDLTLQIIGTTEEQTAAFAKTQTWLAKTELVTDASNYISNARQQDNEGLYTSLLDNDNSTYFHSAWGGSMANTPGHDLQVSLPEAVEDLYLYYVTRANGRGYPTSFRIDGSNNAADFTDAAAGGATWTDNVATLSGLPSGSSTAYKSDKITLSGNYKYLRFVPAIGNNDNGNWFCLAEFHIFSADARAEAARAFLETMPAAAGFLTAEQIAQINTIDQGVTALYNEIQNAVVRGALAEAIAEANGLIACDGVPGYPTTEALNTLAAAVATAQGVLNNGGDYQQACNDLTAATATAKSPNNINYTPSTNVYYTLTNANVPSGNRGSMVYDPSHSASTDAKGDEFLWYTNSLNETDANHLWGFVLYEGEYYMYNVGKKQFANVTQVTQTGSYQGSNGDKHTWIFSDAPSAVTLDAGEGDWIAAPNVRVRATSAVTGKQYAMSISTSYTGPVIAYDAVNDGGIPMAFAVSSVAVDADVTDAIMALLTDLTAWRGALQDAIDAADALNAIVGEGVNKYSVTGDASAFDAALQAAEAEMAKADNETSKAALTTARENLENAQAALTLSLNMPTAGFYRIKASALKIADQPYLQGENSTVTDKTDRLAYSTDDAAASIWYFDGSALYNYGKGVAFANNSGQASLATAGTAGTAVEFVASLNGELGAYSVKFDNSRYLYAQADLYADAASLSVSNPGNGYNFNLEAVTAVPLTLHDGGDGVYYATMYLPVAVSLPSGVTAYTLSLDEVKGVATVSSLGQEVPAATPVLLKGAGASAIASVNAANTAAAVTNALKGSYIGVTTLDSDTQLSLGKADGQVGFYKYDYALKGFRAYLEVPAGSAARGFALSFDDDVTGISAVNASVLNGAAVYDLQGRRVNNAAKGVYIVNGKKVLVK